ncbi:hypothetical protein M422DRAFT_95331, partial [Sphaerobolus stellatus SS14]
LGLPGTGKTTVIAKAVELWSERGTPVWIIAQSNVAVKTLGGKLCERNINYKIVVSKEFFVECREHIYNLKNYIILSYALRQQDQTEIDGWLNGSVIIIILTTLNMLSNPTLNE